MSNEPASKQAKVDSSNSELSKMLLELADYEKNVNKQLFKYNAYRKAAKSVQSYPQKITKKEQIKELQGVGDKICKKIIEYLNKGEINKLEKVRQDDDVKAIQELTRVTGIGPTAAHKFFSEGIKSIDDLRVNVHKLNHHQKVGLKYVDDFEKKIPREEMIRLKDLILAEIEAIDKNYVATVCGSFRRGLSASSDIDILITHPNFVSADTAEAAASSKPIKSKKKSTARELLEKIVNKLTDLKIICDSLAFGDTKFMGVCSVDNAPPFRRIDIRDAFNKNMRAVAIEKGYTLNEYSLRKISSTGFPGSPMKVTSEKDIFDYLGMEFKLPEERNM